MYKSPSNFYVYSASDLTLFMRSPFASWMARLELDKPEQVAGIKKDQDAMLSLLANKGNSHENQYLEKITEEFGANNVAEIITDRETAAADTIKAMQSGFKVIFQAYLQRDNFAGYADFLVRREGKSDLGDYYYEAWDTKLSKSIKPYFLVQLCCYSWMLEAVQGKLPEEVFVVLGNQEKEPIRIAAYYSYFLNLKRQFLNAQKAFNNDRSYIPDPALYSNYGVWGSFAKQLLDKSDSLALVANIRKTQIEKLRVVDICTLTELAKTKLTEVTGIKPETLDKLRSQADLQLQSRGKNSLELIANISKIQIEKLSVAGICTITEFAQTKLSEVEGITSETFKEFRSQAVLHKITPEFLVLKNDTGKGLSALPARSDWDVFFDIEGHPLIEGGLEYLWGVSYYDKQAVQGKLYAFKDWWAHDQEQEKLAFEGLVDWVYQRWQQDPEMLFTIMRIMKLRLSVSYQPVIKRAWIKLQNC